MLLRGEDDDARHRVVGGETLCLLQGLMVVVLRMTGGDITNFYFGREEK